MLPKAGQGQDRHVPPAGRSLQGTGLQGGGDRAGRCPPPALGLSAPLTLRVQLPPTSTGMRRVTIRLTTKRFWGGKFRPLLLFLFTLNPVNNPSVRVSPGLDLRIQRWVRGSPFLPEPSVRGGVQGDGSMGCTARVSGFPLAGHPKRMWTRELRSEGGQSWRWRRKLRRERERQNER